MDKTKKKKTYKIMWTKTYYHSGTVEIEAESEEQAREQAEKEIGNYTGSSQYDPDENIIDVL